ncbi:MAG TPA: NUDIX domain-containing protein [Candidatus Saccharimonadales bacterium]|nr:NUDIX domain-containing protein [Candidatus Saccharimonadales bacterium]
MTAIQSYTIDAGIKEDELPDWLGRAAKKFGVFEDGRVNYTSADTAPIILCVVACGEEFLLLKRGYGLADAEGYWSVITGFIDEVKSVSEQVSQELQEETGVAIEKSLITVGESYTLTNPQEKRRYIIFPCLARLDEKPKIVLNHEHAEYRWITKRQLKDFHILDDLPYAIDAAFAA